MRDHRHLRQLQRPPPRRLTTMRPTIKPRHFDHDDAQHSRRSAVVRAGSSREPSVGFDFDAVERAVSGDGSEDPNPAEFAPPRPKNGDPRPDSDARTIQMMTALVAWLLFGQKADKVIPSAVVKRTIVTGYAVNPDLFKGKKLAQLAKDLGCERESLYAFARDFTKRFGIPVHGSSAERRRLNVKKKADGAGTLPGLDFAGPN